MAATVAIPASTMTTALRWLVNKFTSLLIACIDETISSKLLLSLILPANVL